VSVVAVPEEEELPPLLPLANEDDVSVESILSMDVILSMIILSCDKRPGPNAGKTADPAKPLNRTSKP
jgi:hypothetical protein